MRSYGTRRRDRGLGKEEEEGVGREHKIQILRFSSMTAAQGGFAAGASETCLISPKKQELISDRASKLKQQTSAAVEASRVGWGGQLQPAGI